MTVRWGLGRTGGSIPGHANNDLDAQDHERVELPTQVGSGESETGLARIWKAETKADAEKAFDLFIETYEPKYPKATLCLQKDIEELLAFYDFPAKHWQSLRTTNPIESTFAATDQAIQGVPDARRHAAHDVQTGTVRSELATITGIR